jgi:hypothetical protein
MKNMIRPEAVVLPDDALVPQKGTFVPPPNRFTHEVTRSEPYYLSHAPEADRPDGTFGPQTKVVLLRHDGGERCHVVDGDGKYVQMSYDALRKL